MDTAPTWLGVVAHLHVAPRAFLPMHGMEAVGLVEGRGIVGDRFMIGTEQGFYRAPRARRWLEFPPLRRDRVLSPVQRQRDVTVCVAGCAGPRLVPDL